MWWKLPESHRIFDHLILEGVFSTSMPTMPTCHARGWKGPPSGEGWRDHSPLFVQKDALNHRLSNFRVSNSVLTTQGPDCKGVWYHSAPDRGREL